MGFGAAIASGFNNYANFNGRAARSEYWWWFLFVVLLGIGVGIVGGVLDVAMGSKLPDLALRGVLQLALLLPNLAVAVRRLHDLNRSGWWIGAIFIIWLFVLALFVPVALRMNENHLGGYGAMDGIPAAVFLVMGLLVLVAGVFGLMLFIWNCMRGTRGPNRFGDDPLRA